MTVDAYCAQTPTPAVCRTTTAAPSARPTSWPTTQTPTLEPTHAQPSFAPSATPTATPTYQPSPSPTTHPTSATVFSVMYTSVRCTSNPGYGALRTAVDTGLQPTGYCTVNAPDLQNFSSNRDLCPNGSGSDICALARWTATAPLQAHFAGDGDYEIATLFIDETEVDRFNRRNLNNFAVNITTPGAHNISLYMYEDCCAGSGVGYTGWSITVAPVVTSTSTTLSPSATPTAVPTCQPTAIPTSSFSPSSAPATLSPSSAHPTMASPTMTTSMPTSSTVATGTVAQPPPTQVLSTATMPPTEHSEVMTSTLSTTFDRAGGGTSSLSPIFVIIGVVVAVALALVLSFCIIKRRARRGQSSERDSATMVQTENLAHGFTGLETSGDYEVPVVQFNPAYDTTANVRKVELDEGNYVSTEDKVMSDGEGYLSVDGLSPEYSVYATPQLATPHEDSVI